MIDKKNFVNNVEFDDKNRICNLYDKMLLSNKIGNTVFTDEFYPPNVWRRLEELRECIPVNIFSNGIFEEAERRIIAFSPQEVWHYPLELIKIINKSPFKSLTHREYLGSIMSLGIRRDKFGDLIVKDDICYLPLQDELKEYVIANLKNIGNCPCDVKIVDIYNEDIPQYNFQDLNIISTSNRIDCVLSGITNLSRSKALELISSGKVLMDYLPIKDKDKIVKEKSIITIRGFGKYKFVDKSGLTGSGRQRLLFKKFI
ncbi:YlmH/Sll1252 family protein [Clostridium lundense]|uniref:YlmH/Sll1252 family protein n=1 Tax=Clostridium lundense TaxID=319475 RepID=UPI0006840932|nr:YlmH/Sll1252 family protein [Clostridium lundense]